MNFCPRCGSQRSGNFCAGCGYAFDVEGGIAQPIELKLRQQAIVYGAEYDPDNDCYNCGNPKPKRAKYCTLCDQEF
jgi:hypothetical protein